MKWGWKAHVRGICGRKKEYPSLKAARTKGREQMRENPKVTLWAYRCPLWTPVHFHLSHIQQETSIDIREKVAS